MKFYSTNNPEHLVSFRDAVFQSLPADRGLYMPENIPVLDQDFLKSLHKFSFPEIAFRVAKQIIGDDIPEAHLRQIVEEAVNFEAPLVELNDGTYILELFHGPSLAFKDFGARFMSRVMAYFSAQSDVLLDVLVATSGDTGGAVALGFAGVPNTRVTILFPKGKVSPVQELQLCTNEGNIRAIEVDGNFDDCQLLVKEAFNDEDLNHKLNLTSANSINISRLIPQSFYYFWAYSQLQKLGKANVVFSVPSGNFGNLTAGLMAQRMGLPVKHFIAATNINDVVPRFLQGADYRPEKAQATLSNAMDVGSPSNWARIMNLFDGDRSKISEAVSAYRVTDEQTLGAIKSVYRNSHYVCCPHTAVAWLAGQSHLERWKNDTLVALSTAHPCKFPDVFSTDIQQGIEIPESVNELKTRKKNKISLGTAFAGFKDYLLAR